MTPAERLQTAIDRLTELRDTATEGPWEVDGDGKVWAHPVGPDGARISHLDDVCDPASLNDADLIVALHRGIDAQIALFEDALRGIRDPFNGNPAITEAVFVYQIELADAILGDAS